MAKSAKPVAPVAPSLAASKKASKAPSKAVVTKPAAPVPAVAPASPLGAMAAVLAAPVAAPVVMAPVPAVVATRGRGTVQAVKLGAHEYKVKSAHTKAAWDGVLACLKAGPQPVEAVVKAMGPWPKAEQPVAFIGYCVRRGYLAIA